MQNLHVAASSFRPHIVIAASEHARLLSLAERAAATDSVIGEYLAEELTRAEVIADEDCASNVVRMGSQVTYCDDATRKTREITLVYPKEADIEANRISVLTPIGAALLGLQPSQSMPWLNPAGGMSSLTVLEVVNPVIAA